MDSEKRKGRGWYIMIAVVAIVVLMLSGALYLDIYDCPMCGNHNPMRDGCICTGKGKVNMLKMLRGWALKTMYVD